MSRHKNTVTGDIKEKNILQVPDYLRLLLINIFVFGGLFVAMEFAHRTWLFIRNCTKNSICSGAEFTFYPIAYSRTDFNLTVYDKGLGYVPAPGIRARINVPGWQNLEISHDHNGLRSLINGAPGRANILIVGDSFAYGAQVSDHDTWSSCLNQNNKSYNFHNGAVPGYGTAQSILRAKKLFRSGKYQALIVQTLVGSDLERDKLKAKWGLLRPFFTIEGKAKNIILNNPLPETTPGTKYGTETASLGDYINMNITIFSRIPWVRDVRAESIERIQKSITIKSSNPAPVDKILEWSIKNSLQIYPRPIWILQYLADLNTDHVQKERKLLLERLSDYNIPVIDTFDVLNGYVIKDQGHLIWQGHHTVKGNKIVCEVILKSMFVMG